MQGYSEPPHVNKPEESTSPAEPFTLQHQQPRTKGDLNAWVTRALANIRPWQWDLHARLARTWRRNGNHQNGAHSKERRDREDELRQDLREHARLRGGMAAHRLPGALALRARAVLHQVERLIEGGDWYMPRRYVDQATGQVKETIYLPEDTWSAQSALHWCIGRLGVLVRAAWGMTEKVTPPSSRREPPNLSGWRKEASRDQDPAPWLRCAARWGEGGQPELPATG
jgi:hypothetical protein